MDVDKSKILIESYYHFIASTASVMWSWMVSLKPFHLHWRMTCIENPICPLRPATHSANWTQPASFMVIPNLWHWILSQTTLQRRTADLGLRWQVQKHMSNFKSPEYFQSCVFSLLNVNESYLCHVEEGKKKIATGPLAPCSVAVAYMTWFQFANMQLAVCKHDCSTRRGPVGAPLGSTGSLVTGFNPHWRRETLT